MNHLADLHRASFSGHESFPFRHGWLKKGLNAIKAEPDYLSRPDALVDLGVGKNMVYSIRHWLRVLGLARQRMSNGRPTKEMDPTQLGESLLGEAGWDPYLEDDGTLWLLHFILATAGEAATTWWWAFHRPPTVTFRREQLVNEIASVAEERPWRTTRSSIKRDVDCFVRTYLPVTHGRSTPEDAYAAPLTALGLIQPTLDKDEYILSYGWQPTLPAGIFKWGLAKYLEGLSPTSGSSRTVSLSQLLFDDSSPGRVFRLNEEALVARLCSLPGATDGRWDYDETAGLQQLLVHDELPSSECLTAYYRPRPQLALVSDKVPA